MGTTVDTKAFARSLKSCTRKFKSRAVSAQKTNMNILEKESQALSPFKTGELEGSVSSTVKQSGSSIEGTVTFDVAHAAIRHNDLGSNPGPGTRSKSSTIYGTPGPNYLQNPARGLGKDKTFHKNIEKEVKRS